jgi:hypothetical protein
VCPHCRRKFATENALWTHAAFKHSSSAAPQPDEKLCLEIVCRTCGCAFACEEEVEHHLLQNGSKQLRQLLGDAIKTSTDSEHNSGGLAVNNAAVDAALTRSGTGQTNSSRHACGQCGRKFRDRQALWTHLAFKHPDYVEVEDRDASSSNSSAIAASISRQGPPPPVTLISASKCSVSLDRINLPVEVFSHLAINTAISSHNNTSTNGRHSLPSNNTAQSTAIVVVEEENEKSHNSTAKTKKRLEPSTSRTSSLSSSPPAASFCSSSSNSSTALMRSGSSCSLSSSSDDEEEEEGSSLGSCHNSSCSEEEQVLMTTLVSNALLADHVASLEQRVAELQTYFSRLLSDYTLAAAAVDNEPVINASTAADNGDGLMMIVSAEDIQAMEVGAEVVVAADDGGGGGELSSPEKMVAVSPALSVKNMTGRRRRRTKKQARAHQQNTQKIDGGGGGSDVTITGNSVEPISVEVGNGGQRVRLRA